MYHNVLAVAALFWLFNCFAPPVSHAQAHFTNCSQQTGHSATILIPHSSSLTVDGSELAAGSELAVYTESGSCAGAVVWNGESTGFSVWGDDPQTEISDGFSPGGNFIYRLWDSSADAEYDAAVDSLTIVYGESEPFYRTVNTYAENAIYVVESFGVHFSQSATLDQPSLTSPSDGADDVASSAAFSWTAIDNVQTYHLQVSRTSDFSSLDVDKSSLTATSVEIDLEHRATKHFWRVRAASSDGFGPWSVVQSFTTAIPVPAAPSLLSPSEKWATSDTSVVFSWSSPEFSQSYAFQLARDGAFSNAIVEKSELSAPSVKISELEPASTYYWRARALNESGVSAWSSARELEIGTAAPEVVTLTSPKNGATQANTGARFMWLSSEGADHYQLQVSTSGSFEDTRLSVDSLVVTEYDMPGLESGKTYYWRVRGLNATGPGEWSTSFVFVFGSPPSSGLDAPGLVSPADGSNLQVGSLNLSWKAVQHALQYRVQISEYGDFRTQIVDSKTLTSTSIAVTRLAPGTVYFWRVQATSSDTTSAWSSVWQFATGEMLPGVVALLTPVDGGTTADTLATFSWSPAERSDHYELMVAKSKTFEDLVLSVGELTKTEYLADSFEPGQTYFWRVRGVSSSGPGEWSTPFSLHTPRRLRLEPVLDAPSNGSTVPHGPATFSWNSEAEVTQYLFQLASDSEFREVIEDRDELTSASLTIDDLRSNAVYYWRVAAVGVDGSVEWSETYSFTVPQRPPSVRPTVTAPLNNETLVGDVVTLEWQQVDHATEYRVQLYESGPDGLALIIDSSGVSETMVSFRLPATNEYAWQIQASNEAGISPWSNVSRFTANTTAETGIDDETLPNIFAVHPNYPNPFNPSTTLRFDLPVPAGVSIHIYNALGSLVDVLMSDQQLPSGRHRVQWNAADLPSGTYFCQVRAGEKIEVRTLSLLK